MPLPEGDRVFNIGSSIFVHLIKQIFTVFSLPGLAVSQRFG
jgi:hypothetical protein